MIKCEKKIDKWRKLCGRFADFYVFSKAVLVCFRVTTEVCVFFGTVRIMSGEKSAVESVALLRNSPAPFFCLFLYVAEADSVSCEDAIRYCAPSHQNKCKKELINIQYLYKRQ